MRDPTQCALNPFHGKSWQNKSKVGVTNIFSTATNIFKWMSKIIWWRQRRTVLFTKIITCFKLQTCSSVTSKQCEWSALKDEYCCNLSVGVALNVRFTTNGMCAKNNTHTYVARTSIIEWSRRAISYCCLLPQCEALCNCRLGFPIATVYCALMLCRRGRKPPKFCSK